MRRRYIGTHATELWSLSFELVLDDDGTFSLHRDPRGFAGAAATTVRGRWLQRDTGVTLLLDPPIELPEHDDGDVEIEQVRLSPQPLPTRRFIYREDGPPILWAWRLTLDADGTFTLHETVYAGDDGTESSARGTWNQRGDIVYATPQVSDVTLVPAGKTLSLYEVVGGALSLGHRRFDVDHE